MPDFGGLKSVFIDKKSDKNLYEKIFAFTVLISFFLWLFFIFFDGADSNQFNIFFKRGTNFLADTTNVIAYSAQLDPYTNLINGLGEKAYPPLTYILMYCLSQIVNVNIYLRNPVTMFSNPMLMVMIMVLTIVQMLVLFSLIQVVKKGNLLVKVLLATSVCLSAPVIYTIERGNTILLTACLLIFYLFFYQSDNKILKELALITLAIAAAFKVTPALLGVLLIYDKLYKEALRTIIYGLICIFGPFVFLNGQFSNIPLMFQNMQINLQIYPITDGCTLTAIVNEIVGPIYPFIYAEIYVMSKDTIFWTRVLTYLLTIFLLYAIKYYQYKWQKVAAMVVILLILPSHSGTYCALYLIPVMIMFLNQEFHERIDLGYLFAFIIISWDFMFSNYDWLNYNIRMGILLLLILLVSEGIKQIMGAHKQKPLKDV